jgi:hypothetical protein
MPSSYEDAMIAATAQMHGLTVATRNVSNFNALGLESFRPVRLGVGITALGLKPPYGLALLPCAFMRMHITQLDPDELPTGSRRPWVSRSGDDLLVLTP